MGEGTRPASRQVGAICGGTMTREGDEIIGWILERSFTDPEPPEACAGFLGEGCDEGGVPSLPFRSYKQTNPMLRDHRPIFWRGRAAGGARAPPSEGREEGGGPPPSFRLESGWGTLTPSMMSFC
ncbi:uncharacterized protein SCHCODRAFT_02115394 [Schizophyllum commune H4-8]|uniref:uncharacterized protein n=1 Tax=Schizophyllum commune (strain H4-8 / FGSC 9210) TaxID=578458 RepID=UPI00215E34A5|nr:uncharacterized protein SCHCODRAFT_02115394 [Schizophyllum commune H4-8]KAI5886174.1 hypothetical protein SCHCODRAFT_02115394 [Schizophyllum commune H4-8]